MLSLNATGLKKLVSIGLFGLLLCHVLSYVLVAISTHWQEEHDLTARLTMYRTVDSMVDFFVPLTETPATDALVQAPAEGFSYKGTYYDVVRAEVTGDTLHIMGYENKARSFWQRDLLAFVKTQIAGEESQSQKKANNLLKNFLKEYSPFRRSVIWFFLYDWADAGRILSVSSSLLNRDIPVHSPPPEAIG